MRGNLRAVADNSPGEDDMLYLSHCVFACIAEILFRFQAGLVRLEKPLFDHVMRSIEVRPQQATAVLLSIALVCTLFAFRLSFWVGLGQAIDKGRSGRLQGGFISAVAAGVSAGLWGAAQGRRGWKIAYLSCIKDSFGPPGGDWDAFEWALINMLPDYTHLAERIHDDPKKRFKS